jgi:hypothetical protein
LRQFSVRRALSRRHNDLSGVGSAGPLDASADLPDARDAWLVRLPAPRKRFDTSMKTDDFRRLRDTEERHALVADPKRGLR